MKFIIALATTAALLAACTRDPRLVGVPGMREATPGEVAACTYVADFRAKPGVYGPLVDQGIRYARNSILQGASEAGANTVVFDQTSPGVAVLELHAVAYRC